MLCTIDLRRAPSTCIVHHGAQMGPVSIRCEGRPDIFQTNQGSQFSSLLTYTLVGNKVALYLLGGVQDDFVSTVFTY